MCACMYKYRCKYNAMISNYNIKTTTWTEELDKNYDKLVKIETAI